MAELLARRDQELSNLAEKIRRAARVEAGVLTATEQKLLADAAELLALIPEIDR